MSYTRRQFAKQLLVELKAPVTKRNMRALVAWMQAEGSNARFNPLATTLYKSGATNFNYLGVKNYTSFDQGVQATAETLNYGAKRHLWGYGAIRWRLRHNAFAWRTLRAVEKSAWGTGGLALDCLPWVRKNFSTYADKMIAP